MDFFNSLIDETLSATAGLEKTSFAYDEGDAWKDVGYNQVVLQRDSAYELDGIGFNLITSASVKDEIIVVGDELKNIGSNRKFARISIVQIDDIAEDQKAYDLIRKIEYVKYHYFPDGYMIRTSSRSHKEVVRVSKAAINSGIEFRNVGNLLISRYKQIKQVRGVKVIFISDPTADFKRLETLAQRNNQITETLNHVMNSVNFDCSTCNLKPVCDEVEGMRELHFKSAANGMG
ncbi:MAG: hypothetical protein IJ491_07870 [Clostridia bacterium]|nr:hypothetical protein [Clostridia bacterium]